jgi:hypothetical protein
MLCKEGAGASDETVFAGGRLGGVQVLLLEKGLERMAPGDRLIAFERRGSADQLFLPPFDIIDRGIKFGPRGVWNESGYEGEESVDIGMSGFRVITGILVGIVIFRGGWRRSGGRTGWRWLPARGIV